MAADSVTLPAEPSATRETCDRDVTMSPRKRRRLSASLEPELTEPEAAGTPGERCSTAGTPESMVSEPKSLFNSTAAESSIAPFLTKHIRDQHASRNRFAPADPSLPRRKADSKYCYRHRPDLKCRRQADEPTVDQMQRDLSTLSQNDQQSIAHFWSLFSAAPSKHRNLMLQGIVAQCCFPQLSFLSASVRDLIRIDFVTALPLEISFKILSYLDTASLCNAAQVSRNWRALADDDVVWHRMCEQHIDRKCEKCGWGLPMLDRKRLKDTKRQVQLRAAGKEVVSSPQPQPQHQHRPWKAVYMDRFKVGTNWKYGRCTTTIFRGHTNGVMCLQFDDNILATGSYDATIKIWDIETGKEIRTLQGHESTIRCLQFDDTKLISGSLDRTIKVWNWRSGECISTYTGHQGGVLCLHFDSTTLASGSKDNTIKIWNFQDKSTRILRGHTDWVNSVKLDTASRTVFSASDDLTVRIWDLDTGKCIHTYAGHVGQVQQVLPLPREFEFKHPSDCASDRSDRLSGSESPDHRASHDSTNEPNLQPNTSAPPTQPMSPLFDALFTEDQTRPAPPRFMLTAALDSTLRLWEVHTGRCLRTFFGHIEGVWGLAADTLRLVSGAQDHMAKVWDPRSGTCERTFTGHRGPVTCVSLSDSRMATGSEDSEVRMYSFKA
ncbi:sulfur metabolite repression control protein [Nannizzia gypsea CBS 118893]|uniref:Probable E3 ubiquitin ligase complex SCF subunit sconB n=1 Tax=Arthroderma gypseum (strain ATCC MYA-4604 / CBS 118893) TaxID=535722 RepID=E4URG4_ARTGP|nr:sulfur metabolite repression control protein [Nannizzia gypsea CBS 118893]EFQ99386.1 sulfur metabolite repression control protein [Nannizzia gypsea CBS 118893]